MAERVMSEADEHRAEIVLFRSAIPAELRVSALDVASQQSAGVYISALATEAGRDAQTWALNAVARRFCGPEATWQSMPWTQLRYEHVEALRTLLTASYSPATGNRMLGAVRSVLERAWRLQLYSLEDLERVRSVEPIDGSRVPPGRLLEYEEIADLFAKLRAEHSVRAARDEALISLLYGCGLRRVEASRLTREGLLVDRLRVIGKGNKERMVPFKPPTAAAFVAWGVIRGADEGPFLRRVHKHNIMLPARRDKKDPTKLHGITPGGIWDALRARIAQFKLVPFTPHDLRRSYITHLLDAGADVVAVQKLVGHADPATTGSYDRRSAERLREIAAMLPFPEIT